MDDGFLPRQVKVAEPVSSYQPPTPLPPSVRSSRASSPKRAVLFLILFFLTAVGLVVTWVVREPQSEQVVTSKRSTRNPVNAATTQTDTALDVAEVQTPQPASQTPSDVQSLASGAVASRPSPSLRKHSNGPSVQHEARSEEPVTTVVPSAPKPTTRSSFSGAQEWCVQVFASTNADDADEWNDRLRRKNVEDSRIEMIEKQGQLWYRVRFGRFTSRQEAEQIAQTMGFRNAWINRAR
jgi:cell division septation protein DedD